MLKVFITNAQCYAQGKLEGKWVTLPTSEENLRKEVNEVLSHGGEEYFISAFEGPHVDEYVNIFEINEVLNKIDDEEALNAILECLTVSYKEALEIFENGDYHMIRDVGSLVEAAEILVEDGYYGEIPDHLENFINYHAIANDMVTAKGWKYSEKARAAICRL